MESEAQFGGLPSGGVAGRRFVGDASFKAPERDERAPPPLARKGRQVVRCRFATDARQTAQSVLMHTLAAVSAKVETANVVEARDV